jgi:phospholipid/cholesterol/gamma-HCH transport system substrate-binding protein
MSDITIRISNKTLKSAGFILGAICLVWIGWHVWSSGSLLPKYKLTIYVPDAPALREGSAVRLDGIDVGTVSAIKLAEISSNTDRRIEIDLRILKRYQNEIRNDSTASLATEGLLGGEFVNIQRGFSGNPIPSGGEINVPPMRTMSSFDFVDLISKAATCLEEQKRSRLDKGKPPAK